jgi:thiamine-monophosphate kinase
MDSRIRDETELIQDYLAPLAAGMPGAFGLRDDAALIETEPGIDLVVSTDPVIAGVHFFADDNPQDIAWKALAVNVSDLAAKGAEPIAYTMALAFPEVPSRDWMAAFCAGLGEAQTAFGCKLIGGDTDLTPGPLSIGITAFGKVPHGKMAMRGGAHIGESVFVTGTIGDSVLGLMLRQSPDRMSAVLDDEARNFLALRYLRPLPRLEIVPLLRLYASAAIDVSDGLVKDAERLAGAAGAALAIEAAAIPLSSAARAVLGADQNFITAIASGGGDYEMLLAVPPENRAAFLAAARSRTVPVSEIGVLTVGSGVTVTLPGGAPLELQKSGYDHFQKT